MLRNIEQIEIIAVTLLSIYSLHFKEYSNLYCLLNYIILQGSLSNIVLLYLTKMIKFQENERKKYYLLQTVFFFEGLNIGKQ